MLERFSIDVFVCIYTGHVMVNLASLTKDNVAALQKFTLACTAFSDNSTRAGYGEEEFNQTYENGFDATEAYWPVPTDMSRREKNPHRLTRSRSQHLLNDLQV